MWLFSLIQWSQISLCQNIEYLSFCHVSVKGDLMVIDFDVTRTKKIVENPPPKYSYANPLDCTLCIFTAMGVYLSLLNSTWSENN